MLEKSTGVPDRQEFPLPAVPRQAVRRIPSDVMKNERTGRPGGAEAAAQEELRRIVADLQAIETRLRTVRGNLPLPPETATAEGNDEMDLATEIRSVIDCVLRDSLGPAIRDLRTAAAEPRSAEEPGGL